MKVEFWCIVDVELIIIVMVFGLVVFGIVSGIKVILVLGLFFSFFDLFFVFGELIVFCCGKSIWKLINVMIKLFVICRLGIEMLNVFIISCLV